MNTVSRPMRSSWQIMRSSVYALVIRNLEQQFIMRSSSKRLIDLLRIFIEPFGHILFWTAVKLFRYPNVESGLSPELFILLGVIPWLFTLNTVGESPTVISKNKNLLFFRQIKPIDPLFALFISELGTLSLVFFCAMMLFSLIGFSWHLYDPLRWLLAMTLYIIFSLGLAISFACIGFFSKPLGQFFRASSRLFYLFSGIFFSAQMVSIDYRQVLLLNPLFQCIEISRSCFSDSAEFTSFGDMAYLFKCALVSILMGLAIYSFLRKKLMIEIMEY